MSLGKSGRSRRVRVWAQMKVKVLEVEKKRQIGKIQGK